MRIRLLARTAPNTAVNRSGPCKDITQFSSRCKIAAVLWVIWGLVHTLAGVMTIIQAPSDGFAAIADAVDPALLVADYHPAVGGVLNQHGFDLLWIGSATIVGAVFVWRDAMTAIWVTAMVGRPADVGFLLFVDLPGYVNFVPGTVMTLISATAIVLGFCVRLLGRKSAKAARASPIGRMTDVIQPLSAQCLWCRSGPFPEGALERRCHMNS